MTLEELKELVRQLIGRARIMEAINAIAKWAKDNDQKQLKKEIVLLKGDLTGLEREKRLGILSNSEASTKQNKITYAVLGILDNVDAPNEESDNVRGGAFDNGTDRDFSPSKTKRKPKFGVILHSIPLKMQINNVHRCIIRVAIDEKMVRQHLSELAENVMLKKGIRIADQMEVTFEISEHFTITALNSSQQLVDEYSHTEWNFDVTPLTLGRFPLNFKVAIILENGVKETVLTESIAVGIEPTETSMEFVESTLDLDKIELKTPAEKPSSKIYFSYAWADSTDTDREKIVQELYESLKADGFNVILDKEDLAYRGMISDFMKEIGQGDFIIVAISDKYLKSAYCMYEMYEIFRNSKLDLANFREKIYPIKIESLNLSSPAVLGEYFDHWEQKEQEWEALIKKRGTRIAPAQYERYQRIKAIANELGEFLDFLSDINTKTTDLLSADNFAAIKQAITQKTNV